MPGWAEVATGAVTAVAAVAAADARAGVARWGKSIGELKGLQTLG